MNGRLITRIKMIVLRVITKVKIEIRKPIYTFLNRNNNKQFDFAHVTLYSCGNAGDTVLSECIRRLFDIKFADKINWKLLNLHEKVNIQYLQKLNSVDAVIVGGHGAFLPDTNKNTISGWGWACGREQYKKIKAPLLVFAIGYNYFFGQQETDLFKENVNALLRKSLFFGLRNGGSVRKIQEMIANDREKSKVEYQPCPTMIARMLYPEIPSKKITNKVAFNVALDRADMRMGDEKNQNIILSQIAKSMYELYKRGYEIHFIVHVYHEVAFLDYINQYKFKYYYHPVTSWGAKKIFSLYNEMDVVIGMRGHGIWIPFGVNCKIISLGNQNKTKWFLEDIEALDWLVDINENPENLGNRIIEMFIRIHEKEGNKTTERLLKAQQKLYEITMKNMDFIYNQIG